MDISETLAPNSDQLDAVDLLGSPPRIFTIESVSKGNAEQPVNVHLREFPRPWRPGKSMRRVMAACWTTDASTWPGKQVELFCDEAVMFGGEKVGGVRISRLSHIDKPRSIPLIVKRGKSTGYKVAPLPAAPNPLDLATEALAAIKAATTEAEVRELGNKAHAQGLLDVQAEGQAIRSHVTDALAVLSQATEAEEAQA